MDQWWSVQFLVALVMTTETVAVKDMQFSIVDSENDYDAADDDNDHAVVERAMVCSYN